MSAPSGVTRDHWWWRPGWRRGRSFYTWHITFPSSDSIRRIVLSCAPIISRINTLDPVGIEGVHLTLQGIGFTDEVSRSDIKRIVASTRSRCAQLKPVNARMDEPLMDEEALSMNVHPVEQIAHVKLALRMESGTCGAMKIFLNRWTAFDHISRLPTLMELHLSSISIRR